MSGEPIIEEKKQKVKTANVKKKRPAILPKPTPTVRSKEDSKLGKKGTVGRPEREYDVKIFENLCRAQCTVQEIEAILNTNQVTVDKWCMRHYGKPFNEICEQYKLHGKASLRRTQLKLAEKNAGMAIFLGKNILGQTDQIHTKTEITEKATQKHILRMPDNGRRFVNEPKL